MHNCESQYETSVQPEVGFHIETMQNDYEEKLLGLHN